MKILLLIIMSAIMSAGIGLAGAHNAPPEVHCAPVSQRVARVTPTPRRRATPKRTPQPTATPPVAACRGTISQVSITFSEFLAKYPERQGQPALYNVGKVTEAVGLPLSRAYDERSAGRAALTVGGTEVQMKAGEQPRFWLHLSLELRGLGRCTQEYWSYVELPSAPDNGEIGGYVNLMLEEVVTGADSALEIKIRPGRPAQPSKPIKPRPLGLMDAGDPFAHPSERPMRHSRSPQCGSHHVRTSGTPSPGAACGRKAANQPQVLFVAKPWLGLILREWPGRSPPSEAAAVRWLNTGKEEPIVMTKVKFTDFDQDELDYARIGPAGMAEGYGHLAVAAQKKLNLAYTRLKRYAQANYPGRAAVSYEEVQREVTTPGALHQMAANGRLDIWRECPPAVIWWQR